MFGERLQVQNFDLLVVSRITLYKVFVRGANELGRLVIWIQLLEPFTKVPMERLLLLSIKLLLCEELFFNIVLRELFEENSWVRFEHLRGLGELLEVG
jgi:hypothetical protein